MTTLIPKTKNLITKRIWVLWFQGLSDAPFIVSKCIESWIKENPDWEVVVLTKNNLPEYLAIELPNETLANLSLTLQSDLLRLQLLEQYGGVWVDATTLCMKPLNAWIDDCTSSGFFAFEKPPGRERLISTWFMVAEVRCPIVAKMKALLVAYFLNNDFKKELSFLQKAIRWILNRTISRNEKTTKYWFSPVVTKLFKVHPYFVIHYIFERAVTLDTECRRIWSETKKLSAFQPHKIQIIGMFSPLDEAIQHEIDAKLCPLYKLTWKYDHSKYSNDTVLHYLLEGRHI